MNDAEQNAAADREAWAAYFDMLATQAVQRIAIRRFGRPVPSRHDTIIKREIEKLLASVREIDMSHEDDAPGIVAPVEKKPADQITIGGPGKTTHLDFADISGDGHGINRGMGGEQS